eukprot:CAMPEP_0178380684 /NCGR_PEP_ID=MMETSP0689_2-20121128/5593_1 /TAXON_ID=160604 /ORGANISM="Amphidinium massartii, Strain CS-259" /LENGTH=336 /DNA_ID=CAMNT_0020000841 /DNA_START=74 /DNA_END=1084 /DNA_ORIENTATION=+
MPGAAARAFVAFLVALPRLLWRESMVAEGQQFLIAMALYWNLAYVICFASPFFVLAACWANPLVAIPATIAYGLYIRTISRPDMKDGAPWAYFSKCEWGYHAFRRYLRLRLHVSPTLRARPANKQVVIGVHPHGIASDYRILMDGMLYEALPGRSVLALSASVLFCLPIVRELAVWTRCIDARKSVAARAMSKGHSLLVIPGGEHEQIRTQKGKEEVFLAKRMGFVKLALQAGAALVPSYAFGCVDLYDTSDVFHSARETAGVCIPVYWGAVAFLPKRVPINLVMGSPLEVDCATPGQPTDEEVAAAHAAYVGALKKLFDENKAKFGYEDRTLTVT